MAFSVIIINIYITVAVAFVLAARLFMPTGFSLSRYRLSHGTDTRKYLHFCFAVIFFTIYAKILIHVSFFQPHFLALASLIFLQELIPCSCVIIQPEPDTNHGYFLSKLS